MPIVKNCHVYSKVRSVVVTVEGVDAWGRPKKGEAPSVRISTRDGDKAPRLRLDLGQLLAALGPAVVGAQAKHAGARAKHAGAQIPEELRKALQNWRTAYAASTYHTDGYQERYELDRVCSDLGIERRPDPINPDNYKSPVAVKGFETVAHALARLGDRDRLAAGSKEGAKMRSYAKARGIPTIRVPASKAERAAYPGVEWVYAYPTLELSLFLGRHD